MSIWFPVSSARTAKVAVLLALALSAGATAHAQHRARLSKDLANHLTGGSQNGSQNIEVIVDPEIAFRARRSVENMLAVGHSVISTTRLG